MQLKELKPAKALNKAFLKVKPNRADIERFKENLVQLLDRTKQHETEEFHKNLVSDFLKKTYYDPEYFINTKGRNDLVIHNGNKASTTVGVIIEAKSPANKNEMITTGKLNTKAFQEIVLYYLRERITQKNVEVKHLVITNINEWFIFDSTLFDRLFAQNKNFVKQFNDFEARRLADVTTDFFYKQVAEPFIAGIQQEIEFAYFDLRNYQKPLLNKDREDDKKLIALFKLLSPEHLLKLPFVNDSNSLDKKFYTELLHIIGLSETKEGGKKLIGRNKEGERNSGAILEDAIIQLDSLDKLTRLEKPSHYGGTKEERLFNVALELCITWINRVLFLKLLEAQLINYHKDDQSYSFLNSDKIRSYDDLNRLFFQVLARRFDERNSDVKKTFEKVPYLNSSLFEPTDIEQVTLFISNLNPDKTIPVISSTVLKDAHGKKVTENLKTLDYLFRFLDAYDFSGDGGEDIQEDNKTLINASVLGLIFEKINGYKDGSYFTPGFITMYICHETIRKAVVEKFSEYCLNHGLRNFKLDKLEDVGDLIPEYISRKNANDIVNSLKICDPAVGSGHFLVSALNEIISVKSDLKILEDKDGKSLHWYEITVENDELAVTDQDGELFQYHPGNKESQRIQETLFHEKETIIENCLFGVDINPNSVKICRLRLWIELLKNAYYKSGSNALETLPNIDINIKCGNSLVSRFAIDADLKQALKKSKWTIDGYKVAVDIYRNAENKEEKREMEKLIENIKSDFRSEILFNDSKRKRLRKIKDELANLSNQTALFEKSKKEKEAWNKRVQKLTTETKKLEAEIEEIKNNKIYENAFEWRFEFPEVLNDEGDFVGFDVVIGNPPYGVKLRETEIQYYRNIYSSIYGHAEIYYLFIELGLEKLIKKKSLLAYITPNAWLSNKYAKGIRIMVLKNYSPLEIINFNKKIIFEDAQVETSILIASSAVKKESLLVGQDVHAKYAFELKYWFEDENLIINFSENEIIQRILRKINSAPLMLSDIVDISNGCKPYQAGYGKNLEGLKLTVSDVVDRIYHSKSKLNDQYYPELKGKHVMRYYTKASDDYIKWGTWLMSPKESRYFFQDKILVRQIIGQNFICTLDKTKSIADQTLYVATKYEGSEIALESVLGILNSNLYGFFFRKFYSEEDDLFPKIKVNELKRLPYRKPSKDSEVLITSIVTQILAVKSENSQTDTTDLENQIDQLVYQLYGLTEEEIEIVENDSK
ncbi:MAG: DUF7149 domain-containing protein [Agriterribacter sp.]